jgi:hypothetical protein
MNKPAGFSTAKLAKVLDYAGWALVTGGLGCRLFLAEDLMRQ